MRICLYNDNYTRLCLFLTSCNVKLNIRYEVIAAKSDFREDLIAH